MYSRVASGKDKVSKFLMLPDLCHSSLWTSLYQKMPIYMLYRCYICFYRLSQKRCGICKKRAPDDVDVMYPFRWYIVTNSFVYSFLFLPILFYLSSWSRIVHRLFASGLIWINRYVSAMESLLWEFAVAWLVVIWGTESLINVSRSCPRGLQTHVRRARFTEFIMVW